MKLVILVLSAFIGSAFSWGGYKINFEHTDLEFDEKMVNIEMSMKRSEDRTVVNARAELFEDIDDPIVFHVSHYERVNKEYQHLMNSSVNACNVMGRFKSHPIVKIILKELLKNSNLPTSCPLKKNIYFMKDFSVNEDLLPPFIPTGSFMAKVRIARVVDGEEMVLLKVNVFIDIDMAKERKGFKLF